MTSDITTISAETTTRWRQLIVDLWLYRDLFISLVERDIKLRYKQTALGVIWVILQPLVTAGAFALIFGKVAKMPVGNLPYSLFYLSALVPWICFAQSLSAASMSIEGQASMISKVYFPRMIVPCAAVLGTVPDFLIGFAFLNLVAALLGQWSFWLVAVMPVLLLMQLAAAIGAGLFLAALNAQYRDVKYAIPFLIQVGLLATPIIYPLHTLPEWAIRLQALNPMAGVVTAYRWAVGGETPGLSLLMANAVAAAILLALGSVFFQSRERRLADVL
jgi:lipopolysaccharide transport system permease protein